jgi:hypothetical protein
MSSGRLGNAFHPRSVSMLTIVRSSSFFPPAPYLPASPTARSCPRATKGTSDYDELNDPDGTTGGAVHGLNPASATGARPFRQGHQTEAAARLVWATEAVWQRSKCLSAPSPNADNAPPVGPVIHVRLRPGTVDMLTAPWCSLHSRQARTPERGSPKWQPITTKCVLTSKNPRRTP